MGIFLRSSVLLYHPPVAYLLTVHDGGEDWSVEIDSALSQAFATAESNLKSNFCANTGVMATVKATKINVFTVSFRLRGLRSGPAENCIRGQTQPGSQTLINGQGFRLHARRSPANPPDKPGNTKRTVCDRGFRLWHPSKQSDNR